VFAAPYQKMIIDEVKRRHRECQGRASGAAYQEGFDDDI
jgi:hypothetical protein